MIDILIELAFLLIGVVALGLSLVLPRVGLNRTFGTTKMRSVRFWNRVGASVSLLTFAGSVLLYGLMFSGCVWVAMLGAMLCVSDLVTACQRWRQAQRVDEYFRLLKILRASA